jgi:hypothetical protein
MGRPADRRLHCNFNLSQSVIPIYLKLTTIIFVPMNSKATCHNYYRPVALTSVIMKYFERLVSAHITFIIPDTLDPLQFAYRPNRSTDDAISIALHNVLSHLDKRNTFVRMLFIDYSSAFNILVPSKFKTLGLNTPPCGMVPQMLRNIYSCTIESILTCCITIWQGNCTAHVRKALHSVVQTAQRFAGREPDGV